jgi:hypothetical protein
MISQSTIDELRELRESDEKATSAKECFLVEVKRVLENHTKNRNSMGCLEANYDVYYMIGRTFAEDELNNLTEHEIDLLLKLANYASEAFY